MYNLYVILNFCVILNCSCFLNLRGQRFAQAGALELCSCDICAAHKTERPGEHSDNHMHAR